MDATVDATGDATGDATVTTETDPFSAIKGVKLVPIKCLGICRRFLKKREVRNIYIYMYVCTM